jgi:hypothetical protein
MWPTRLPAGFVVDPASLRASWTDYVLQGGSPFFILTAEGPRKATFTLEGGSNSFLVPEGVDIEHITTEVHGRGATAVRSPEGAAVVWAEHGSFYRISSPSMSVEALVRVANGLEPIDAATFAEHSR